MGLSVCPDCGCYDVACGGNHVKVTLTQDTCINGVLYPAGSVRLMPAPPAVAVVAATEADANGANSIDPNAAGTDGASSNDASVTTIGAQQTGGSA